MNRALSKTVAYGLGVSRVAIGSVALAVPGFAMKTWLGVDAGSGPVKAMGLAIGARDLALGAGTLAALRSNTSGKVWLYGGVLSDAADAVATVRAFSSNPRNPRMLIALAAAGAAAGGAWAARQAND
ncbi:MAG: hypothetical protein WD178_11790 [Actinomycetota bacterium]